MNRGASAALAGWSWTSSGRMKTRLSVAAPWPPFALFWIATAMTDRTMLIERLVKRVDRATAMLCMLLRERGYSGRLRVRVSVNTGMGYDLNPWIHTGSSVVSVADDLDTIRSTLVPMLSQMTRSWLSYPFTILRWQGNDVIITDL
jgi:hypothetical protein